MSLPLRCRNLLRVARSGVLLQKELLEAQLARRPRRLEPRQQELLGQLRRDGLATVQAYWPRDRALRMGERLREYLQVGSNHDFPEGAYARYWDAELEDSSERPHDAGVRRVYHVDKLVPELAEFRHDPFVLGVAAAYYRVPMFSALLAFQYNCESTHVTRYFHLDAFEREFKAFLYLDDVDEGNGPFAYLRTSHSAALTRLKRQITVKHSEEPTSFEPRAVRHLLAKEAHITGPAGTLILADVRGLHRGTPQRERSRSVLV
ncbi:MAG TPA: hypothetical protein VKU60_08740, partial [Chloroflexota bacterium]|nr:hypothetical protein [Chloroflexota bacterium]